MEHYLGLIKDITYDDVQEKRGLSGEGEVVRSAQDQSVQRRALIYKEGITKDMNSIPVY